MTRHKQAPRSVAAALLAPVLVLSGCVTDSDAPTEPQSRPSVTGPPEIHLGDVSVGIDALDERAGLYVCGGQIVASAPSGGIAGDSFVVFDRETGEGEITEVELPRGLAPNARWLLSSECVDSGDDPYISVAYQEMPLAFGDEGVRAAYNLEGEQLWMRQDLNEPATVVDEVLVMGSAPEQPETAVDLETGRTLATFDPSVQARTVVATNRVVVRSLTGPPALTTLTGKRVAILDQATTYTADGGLLFGITPAALPDTESPAEPDAAGGEGLTDASPSPSPTRTPVPAPGSGLFRGRVQAYSLKSGEPVWRLGFAPDPLGVPRVEPKSGLVILVDVNGLARAIDRRTGRQEWRAPTELDNPRVTAGGGVVLFDKLDDNFQKVVDARTGLPLPEPEERVIDLSAAGALQMVDGVATVVSVPRLRNPPTTLEEPTG